MSGATIEQAEARHQQVREFVEREYPHCRVVDVHADVRTNYKRALHSEEYVLVALDIRYDVEAVSVVMGQPGVRVRVRVTNDGQLRLTDPQYVFMGW